LSLGLLPPPIKQGIYRGGVSLIFLDKEMIISVLARIYELKGLGYAIKEIKKVIIDERQRTIEMERKEDLVKYIEIDGRYYINSKNEPDNIFFLCTNLPDIILSNEKVIKDLEIDKIATVDHIKRDAAEIASRGLYVPRCAFNRKAVYNIHDLSAPAQWIVLRRKYGLSWDVLEGIYKKQRENLSKYIFWPEPDGIKFSREKIGYLKQYQLNEFGGHLLEYIEMISGNLNSELQDEFSGLYWDYKYDDIQNFIDDFLSGRCAFVPYIFSSMDDRIYILKKL
jgi:hypothetical protein